MQCTLDYSHHLQIIFECMATSVRHTNQFANPFIHSVIRSAFPCLQFSHFSNAILPRNDAKT